MQGSQEIDKIMEKIKPHLLPNTAEEHHYNRVYEAIWRWSAKRGAMIEKLSAEVDRLKTLKEREI